MLQWHNLGFMIRLNQYLHGIKMWVWVTPTPNHPAIILTPGLPQHLLMWMKISHKNNWIQKVKLTIVPLSTTKTRNQQWDPLVSRSNPIFASASWGPARWLPVPRGVACRRRTDGSITTGSLTFVKTNTVIIFWQNLTTLIYNWN